MSLTAIAVMLVYLAGLLMGLFWKPIFALYSYLWIFYNDPQVNWWGHQLPGLRYSLIAAFLALLLTSKVKSQVSEPWLHSGGAKLVLAYGIWACFQTFWAVNITQHIEGAVLFSKYAVLSFVIYRMTSEEKNIELFLLAHVIGCFIFGWAGFTTDVSGRLETVGGAGVDDSNLLAAHLVTGLAISAFMVLGCAGYVRWIALGALPFILNAIILTQSRGGFLALCVSGPAAWYLAPKGYRRLVALAVAGAAVLMLALSNDSFWERISTIKTSTEENQTSRLDLIGPQFQMFLDHPFGAGHRGNEVLSRSYMPPELLSNSGNRAAHNTFMAALVDQGFPGALFLLGLYGWVGITLLRLKKLDKQGLPAKLGLYRAALGAALVSCFISGLFLNLLKSEVQIWLIAVLASLAAISRQAVSSEKAPEATAARAGTRRRRPGLRAGSAARLAPRRDA